MIELHGEVVGAAAVETRLVFGSARVREALVREISIIGVLLQNRVKRKLTGEVLRVRTGRLRNSINLRITETDTRITASVGTAVKYGRVHELGYSGVQQVRDHVARRGNLATIILAHTRRVDLPARSFLRSSLDDLRSDVTARLRRATRVV